ncbi:hypothetical protein [Phytopseudomonas argentinensis]|uniref:hypothetical protein n=1 Tax=Phytopseudomonas argentinensis TaxID=289370 RepID=UPI001113BC68|nr:hypothetical protein [Pseudomonas argentinensis]
MIDTEWNLALAQPVGPYAGRNLPLSLVAMKAALKRLLSQIEQLLQRERRFGCGPQPVHRGNDRQPSGR